MANEMKALPEKFLMKVEDSYRIYDTFKSDFPIITP